MSKAKKNIILGVRINKKFKSIQELVEYAHEEAKRKEEKYYARKTREKIKVWKELSGEEGDSKTKKTPKES